MTPHTFALVETWKYMKIEADPEVIFFRYGCAGTGFWCGYILGVQNIENEEWNPKSPSRGFDRHRGLLFLTILSRNVLVIDFYLFFSKMHVLWLHSNESLNRVEPLCADSCQNKKFFPSSACFRPCWKVFCLSSSFRWRLNESENKYFCDQNPQIKRFLFTNSGKGFNCRFEVTDLGFCKKVLMLSSWIM